MIPEEVKPLHEAKRALRLLRTMIRNQTDFTSGLYISNAEIYIFLLNPNLHLTWCSCVCVCWIVVLYDLTKQCMYACMNGWMWIVV